MGAPALGPIAPSRVISLVKLVYDYRPGPFDTTGGFDLDDGGRDWDEEPATGVYVRKDRFTASLEIQHAVENESSEANESHPEDGASGAGQESLALLEPEPRTSQPSVTGSFVAYMLQKQA